MKKWWIALIGIAVIGLAGCAQPDTATESSSSSSAKSTTKAQSTKIDVSLAQAWTAFEQAYPDANVTQVELERTLGSYQYTIEGQDSEHEIELVIDARSGKTLRKHQEALEADDQESAISRAGLVDRQKASTVATKQVGDDATATAWQLDREDAHVVWEVTVVADKVTHEVTLDAYSAEILRVEKDD